MIATPDISDSFACVMQDIDGPLGLAVSGGGDSVAMLHLAVRWAEGRNQPLFVYCVDHGLRDEAADEAAFVATLCAGQGITARILKWSGWDGQGNLSAKARAARYDLIAEAAKADGVDTVLLAHTRDDQAETFLMSLARRSGVDGLSGMPLVKKDRGITWMRPLLGVGRDELRDYLKDLDQIWCDDPSNEDDAYERVRMRKAQPMLDGLGLTAGALGDVAENMQAVREVLEGATGQALKRHAVSHEGAVKLNVSVLDEPTELQRRILKLCLGWVAPSAPAARGDAVTRALVEIAKGKDCTLQGCLILRKGDTIWVLREPAAASGETTKPGGVWDARWIVNGPDDQSGYHVSALSEAGLSECENWRDSGLPRAFFLSSPAIWQGERLIAAPKAGYSNGWSAELVRSDADFHNAHTRR